MKKIVALVLCLVLALSLCTVAFGATTTTAVEAKGYKLLNSVNADQMPGTVTTFTKTVQDATSVTDKDGKVTTIYYATKWDINGTNYYEVDSSVSGALKLVKDGAIVAFVKATGEEVKGTKTASSFVKKSDKTTLECGDAKANYFVIGSDIYGEGASEWVLLNGKFVQVGTKSAKGLADDTYFVQHKFNAATKYNTVEGKLSNVTCPTCKKAYDTVKEVPSTYTGDVVTVRIDGLADAYILMGTAAGTTTDKTVESAKTFDAGIALYAGMALASVAGSAVVIGKKKEF